MEAQMRWRQRVMHVEHVGGENDQERQAQVLRDAVERDNGQRVYEKRFAETVNASIDGDALIFPSTVRILRYMPVLPAGCESMAYEIAARRASRGARAEEGRNSNQAQKKETAAVVLGDDVMEQCIRVGLSLNRENIYAVLHRLFPSLGREEIDNCLNGTSLNQLIQNEFDRDYAYTYESIDDAVRLGREEWLRNLRVACAEVQAGEVEFGGEAMARETVEGMLRDMVAYVRNQDPFHLLEAVLNANDREVCQQYYDRLAGTEFEEGMMQTLYRETRDNVLDMLHVLIRLMEDSAEQ